jgi:ABC-type spermidine/putrescine transport system permease subunit II
MLAPWKLIAWLAWFASCVAVLVSAVLFWDRGPNRDLDMVFIVALLALCFPISLASYALMVGISFLYLKSTGQSWEVGPAFFLVTWVIFVIPARFSSLDGSLENFTGLAKNRTRHLDLISQRDGPLTFPFIFI